MSIAHRLDTDLMVISIVWEVNPHGAQHTAHGKLCRVITAANKNLPKGRAKETDILTVGTAKHQGASHSAAEEHVWDGGTRCGPRSHYRLLTRQAIGTSYIADYSPK